MGDFPALLLVLVLTGPCLARVELEMLTAVQGRSFKIKCYYDSHKYLQDVKFWCKQQAYSCHIIVQTKPARGRNYLNTAQRERVNLTDSGTGWFSVSMTELRVEDSGTYLCGISYPVSNIPLRKMKVMVSYEAPINLSAKEGDSISLKCSYFETDDHRIPDKFIWCKMVTAAWCQPIISTDANQSVNTQGRTRIKLDRWNREIKVALQEVQLQDSGEYHCESHLHRSTMLLKIITLNVLELSLPRDTVSKAPSSSTNEERTTHPTVVSNEEQRTLYLALAAGSILAGSAVIATISLVAAIFTRGRKRGSCLLSFGEHPKCRLAAQQKDEGYPRNVAPDGELKNSLIYAMLKRQPKPKPDDVTYANVELPQKPEGAKGSAEPAAVLFSSGTMEYANIIFGNLPPQAGTRVKQTGPHSPPIS
ncbi:trem-like transcript 1 protein [Carettochelys insculpta]|uniref:trem-like transcript 1 protein n=1 Tax=Carettochelys insculpta TaxID=44489 RepID=UPI003EB8C8F3